MRYTVTVEGFCPTQGKEYSIEVDYIESSGFKQATTYKKGLMTCDFIAFGDNDCPLKNDCPLFKSAAERRVF